MFDKMKEMLELQKKAKEVQKLLESVKVQQTSRDGKIRLVMNGGHQVEELAIDESLLSPDRKKDLEKAVGDLINEAVKEVRQQSAAQAMGMMKGLDLKMP